MGSLSGYRRPLALIAVLIIGVLVIHLVSAKLPPLRRTPAFPTDTTGTVFAAGVGGRGPGTGSSDYQSHCASCHGAGGKGNGWTAWLYRLKMRDLSDPSYTATLKDEYLFQVIKQGGDTLGKPGMPSWGQELSDREIRDLVIYIRSLAAPPQQPQATGSRR